MEKIFLIPALIFAVLLSNFISNEARKQLEKKRKKRIEEMREAIRLEIEPKGLWLTLTDDQKERALGYRGPEIHPYKDNSKCT